MNLAIKKPISKFYLFLLLLICLTLNIKFFGNYEGLDLRLLMALSIGFIGLDRLLVLHKIRLRIGKIHYVWVFFVLLLISSLFWSRSLNYGTNKLYIILSLLLLPILWGKLWVQYFYTYRVLYVLIYLFLLYDYLLNNALDLNLVLGTHYGRLRAGDNSNEIVVATFFGSGIIYMWSFIQKSKKNKVITKRLIWNLQRVFLLSVAIFSMALVFLTGSKGPMLAIIGSFFVYYFFKKFNVYYLASFSVLAVVGIAFLLMIDVEAAVLSLFPADFHGFISRRFFDTSSEGSYNSRLAFFKLTLTSFADKNILAMFFGSGLGDFGYVSEGIDSRQYPHNIFFEILHELGLIGLALFSYMVYYACKLNVKYKNHSGEIKWLLIIFYFFFIRSLTTGDLAENFGVFAHLLLLVKYDDLSPALRP